MLQDLYAFQEKKIRLENGENPGEEQNDEEEPQPEKGVKPVEAGDSTSNLQKNEAA